MTSAWQVTALSLPIIHGCPGTLAPHSCPSQPLSPSVSPTSPHQPLDK